MHNLKILCYHGVTNIKSKGIENKNNKHISFKIFDYQIKKIKKNYNPISMNEVIMHFKEKIKFPKNSIAITFDDGFKNNYEVAAPILAKYQIPATFYISTGYVNSRRMFWVDEIEDCLNRTKKKKINLKINNFNFNLNLNNNLSKINSLKFIKKKLKKINIKTKKIIIKKLINLTDIIPNVESSKNYQKLTNIEIKNLDANELFTIGSHGVNHESMALLEKNQLELEIKNSINYLENLLKKEITHYSYPEGQPNDFNEYVIKKLKEMKIQCCPTAIPGVNDYNTDLFKLKRYMIGLDNKYNII